ncbi:MAG: hypothetical protein CM15mP58_10910 [Burkholderiaceae bacterium]|nr:MAG: hypothetical protein CM15mP58_10910 [Burkholderiaceae bacterium]
MFPLSKGFRTKYFSYSYCKVCESSFSTTKQSVFVRERTPPKASVVVTPIPNRVVTTAQVDAMIHLVSSSIPYLDPSHVSVVDNFGNLLTKKNDSAAGLSTTQLSHKQDVEQTYRSRILEILTPVFGEGNVQAQVDCFNQFQTNRNNFRGF